MIMITSFANPRVAQAFVDYMATQGVILTVQQHTQSDVWLADESQTQLVRAELERFQANPGDPRYQAASWSTGHSGVGFSYKRYPFFATIKERAGPLTLGVIFVCIALFVLLNLVGFGPVISLLGWPLDPSQRFELWRYFTHGLLHFSFMHIIFNLLWWWYLGGAVEKRLGTGKLLTLTLISTLLSGFMQAKFTGPLFGGLSGTVFALMGYVWLRGERDPDSGIQMQRGLLTFAIIWLAIEVFTQSAVIPAHLTGMLVGLAMALVDTLNARKRT
ncbi:Rhomboid protease glpG [Cedecea davisae]|uniref:rhomboid family intramembrane serine protease GlpG n=1 Tax=Cedecea davisae TaxID=158484 RepID=UPI0005868AC6|nr:rhomboid family intramembrane serine protease GlpG [Cedecea davisae]SUX37355.1 Rhomboid protease glpG [Cedecea davisae]